MPSIYPHRGKPNFLQNEIYILKACLSCHVVLITQSWELGTLAEALTESEWPRLTPYMPNSIFPPARLPWYENAYDVLSIAEA